MVSSHSNSTALYKFDEILRKIAKRKKQYLCKLLDNLVNEFYEEGETLIFGVADNSRINQHSGKYFWKISW